MKSLLAHKQLTQKRVWTLQMVQHGTKTNQGHHHLQKKKGTSVVLHCYEAKTSGENNLKQDGTTYLVEVGESKRINASKYGESDAPLIGVIRLVG